MGSLVAVPGIWISKSIEDGSTVMSRVDDPFDMESVSFFSVRSSSEGRLPCPEA